VTREGALLNDEINLLQCKNSVACAAIYGLGLRLFPSTASSGLNKAFTRDILLRDTGRPRCSKWHLPTNVLAIHETLKARRAISRDKGHAQGAMRHGTCIPVVFFSSLLLTTNYPSWLLLVQQMPPDQLIGVFKYQQCGEHCTFVSLPYSNRRSVLQTLASFLL
jgi:hypothetical protein